MGQAGFSYLRDFSEHYPRLAAAGYLQQRSETIARALEEVWRLTCAGNILLYGSLARSDFGCGSDVDALVIASESSREPFRVEGRVESHPASVYIVNETHLSEDARFGRFGGFYIGKLVLPVLANNERARSVWSRILSDFRRVQDFRSGEPMISKLSRLSPSFRGFISAKMRGAGLSEEVVSVSFGEEAVERDRIPGGHSPISSWPDSATVLQRFAAEGQRHYPQTGNWWLQYCQKLERASA